MPIQYKDEFYTQKPPIDSGYISYHEADTEKFSGSKKCHNEYRKMAFCTVMQMPFLTLRSRPIR